MIAIITSTIFPLPPTTRTEYRNTIPSQARLMQTVETVKSLVELDFEEIYLFDNSGFNWDESVEDLLAPAKVIKLNSFQYENKGLSELYMLLQGLSKIPRNKCLFKISGRYQLKKKIDENELAKYDFIGKHSTQSITTRGYYFKNKTIMRGVLLFALNYIFAYKHKIIGPRSFLRVFKNAFFTNYEDVFYESSISIEQGMYKAIRKCNLKIKNTDHLHIQGMSASPSDKNKIIYE